jgi:hypothetical protein
MSARKLMACATMCAKEGAGLSMGGFTWQVLSVDTALSIQSHPDKQLAGRLHAERPEVRLSRDKDLCVHMSKSNAMVLHVANASIISVSKILRLDTLDTALPHSSCNHWHTVLAVCHVRLHVRYRRLHIRLHVRLHIRCCTIWGPKDLGCRRPWGGNGHGVLKACRRLCF